MATSNHPQHDRMEKVHKRDVITHRHHIVPKHMGGSDDPSNIVELSIEEHAAAHKALYEQYGKWEDKLAWKALSGQIGKEDIIKCKLIEAGKKSSTKGNSLTSQHKAKIAASKIGKKRPDISGGNGIRARRVVADGIYFATVTECAQYFEVTPHTVRNRIKSSNFQYEYVNEHINRS